MLHSSPCGVTSQWCSSWHERGQVLFIHTGLAAHSPSVDQYQQFPSLSGVVVHCSHSRQVNVHSLAPRRERQPPRSDRATHSDLPSVSCGRLLHVAAQSLCMKPGFFSHSPWSAQEPQLGLLSVFPAGHSSCRRGTAAGAVEGRGDDRRGRGWPRSSRCTALSTGGG